MSTTWTWWRLGLVCFATFQGWGTAAWAEPASDDIIELSRRMVTLQQEGKHAEAIPLGLKTLGLSEEALGPDHPTVAIYLDYLGKLYRIAGEDPKAEPLFRRALAIREKTFGPDHPALAASLAHLATLYGDEHRYGDAEPLFQRALALKEKHNGTA